MTWYLSLYYSRKIKNIFFLVPEKWTSCDSRTKETSGTCAVVGCDESRGPTKCIEGKCICADNHFTEDGEKCIPCPIEKGKEYSVTMEVQIFLNLFEISNRFTASYI